jgi:hypothetical protein
MSDAINESTLKREDYTSTLTPKAKVRVEAYKHLQVPSEFHPWRISTLWRESNSVI